jgi:tetratricopeptide (TPR) repeat protein
MKFLDLSQEKQKKLVEKAEDILADEDLTYSETEPKLTEYVQQYPESYHLLWTRAECFTAMGNDWGDEDSERVRNYESAIQDYRLTIDLATRYPTTISDVNEDLSKCYFQLADCLMAQAKVNNEVSYDPEVIKCLEQAAKLDPKNPSIYEVMGNYFFNIRPAKYAEGVVAYKQLLSIEPLHYSTLDKLRDHYRKRGELIKAIELYTSALTHASGIKDIYAMDRYLTIRAKLYEDLYDQSGNPADYQKAEKDFVALQNLDLTNEANLNIISRFYLRHGKNDLALKVWTDAIKLTKNPGDLKSFYSKRAELYEKMGLLGDAKKDIVALQNLKPTETYHLDSIYQFYHKHGQEDLAIKVWMEAPTFTKDPGTLVGIYQHRSALYEKMGRLEDAANDLLTVTNLKPGQTYYLYNISEFYIKHGKDNLAIKVWTDTIKLTKDPFALVQSYRKRAELYEKTGQLDDAANDLVAIVNANLDEGDEVIRNYLKDLSDFYLRHNIPEQAIKVIDQLKIAPSQKATFLHSLYSASFENKQYEAALVLNKKVLELAPQAAGTTEIREHKGAGASSSSHTTTTSAPSTFSSSSSHTTSQASSKQPCPVPSKETSSFCARIVEERAVLKHRKGFNSLCE